MTSGYLLKQPRTEAEVKRKRHVTRVREWFERLERYDAFDNLKQTIQVNAQYADGAGAYTPQTNLIEAFAFLRRYRETHGNNWAAALSALEEEANRLHQKTWEQHQSYLARNANTPACCL